MSEDRDYPLASDIGLLFIFQILHCCCCSGSGCENGCRHIKTVNACTRAGWF